MTDIEQCPQTLELLLSWLVWKISWNYLKNIFNILGNKKQAEIELCQAQQELEFDLKNVFPQYGEEKSHKTIVLTILVRLLNHSSPHA